MQNINAFDHAETILKVLAKGAFLTTAAGGRHNTMTIGWGALGNIWGKPVFTVMVRHSRYTHELIEAHNEFTVSFPLTAAFSKALGLCGSKSGRDMDKFAAAEITPAEGQTVKVPVIKGAGLHLECRITEQQADGRVESRTEGSSLLYDLAAGSYRELSVPGTLMGFSARWGAVVETPEEQSLLSAEEFAAQYGENASYGRYVHQNTQRRLLLWRLHRWN